eukprot:TRINITY_DN9429_c0_g2_i1.p1 TRINITY_DN9429_c0_g2~~TRINITY_DN9429_c0_g2_i1.p1  ORF type:complete len:176 (-),score=32.47 TRINITY_DN9429_c0_g2_i1:256-783(-)
MASISTKPPLQSINNASVTDAVANALNESRYSHPEPTCQLFEYYFPQLGSPVELSTLYERFFDHYSGLTGVQVHSDGILGNWSSYPILYSYSAIHEKLVEQFCYDSVYGGQAMTQSAAEAVVTPFLSAITGGQDLGDALICLVVPTLTGATFEWGYVVFNTRDHIVGMVHCSEED